MARAGPVRTLQWQGSLFDLDAAPAVDPSLTGLRRIALDSRSWVDLLPGWLTGGDALLEHLANSAPWDGPRARRMYDRVVDEPRILARWPAPLALPAAVAAARDALGARYRTAFDRVAVNLYRTGRDSVAWHGDRVRLMQADPIVATVSLGARRRFLLRPRGGGRATLALRLGGGDLLVMGGACQHDFEHAVPKVAHSGARMAITFRHSGRSGSAPAATSLPDRRPNSRIRGASAR